VFLLAFSGLQIDLHFWIFLGWRGPNGIFKDIILRGLFSLNSDWM